MNVSAMQASFLGRIAPDSHFHLLFDSLPEVFFFVKDVEGRLLFGNSGLLALYGMPSESELSQRTDFDLLPRELAQKYRKDDLAVMRTGVPALGLIELFLSPQGLPRWYVTDKMPVRAEDGTVMGVMGSIRPHADGGQGLADGRLQPSIERMAGDLTLNDPITDLSKLCGMSIRQFEQRFRAVYNISPSKFRIRLRLTRACELLSGTDLPVSQVALEAGFYDQSALHRQFRSVMGITPLQYRRRYTS